MDVIEADQLTPTQAFNHWYYQSKFDLLSDHLDRLALPLDVSVADVGCGIGLFLTLLERSKRFAPHQMVGIDLAYTEPTLAVQGQTVIRPDWPSGDLFDLILMMHVLEHVEDDRAMLADAANRLSDSGYIFIDVPAFPFLYSAHDRFLGHYRRYTTETLKELVLSTGNLELINVHYFFAAAFPAAAAVRLFRGDADKGDSSDLKPLPAWLNKLLIRGHRVERRIARFNNLFGLSAIAIARKIPRRTI